MQQVQLPIDKIKPDDYRCDVRCPSFDGKRCEILGHQPEGICEPYARLLGVQVASLTADNESRVRVPTPIDANTKTIVERVLELDEKAVFKTIGREDVENFFPIVEKWLRDRVPCKQHPILCFEEKSRPKEIIVHICTTVSAMLYFPPKTKVMVQWPGKWRSDFFHFTVGEFQTWLKLRQSWDERGFHVVRVDDEFHVDRPDGRQVEGKICQTAEDVEACIVAWNYGEYEPIASSQEPK